MHNQDIIVIGASAGGVVALQALVSALSPAQQSILFVVVHTTPNSPGLLPEVLNNAGPLPASNAINHELFLPGHIYVAPPNYHLLVGRGYMHVVRGPLVNHVRPSIDVLFRSAAFAYGKRVTGILLSGLLDDGVAGLGAIKDCGGSAVVQEPAEAQFKEMPLNALRRVKVDFCLTIAKIAQLINDSGQVEQGTVKGGLDVETHL